MFQVPLTQIRFIPPKKIKKIIWTICIINHNHNHNYIYIHTGSICEYIYNICIQIYMLCIKLMYPYKNPSCMCPPIGPIQFRKPSFVRTDPLNSSRCLHSSCPKKSWARCQIYSVNVCVHTNVWLATHVFLVGLLFAAGCQVGCTYTVCIWLCIQCTYPLIFTCNND